MQGDAMTCIRIPNGFVCTAYPFYRYKGFYMEFHRYCGPFKLKQDGEPAKRSGRKFWKIAQELWDMPQSERDKFRWRPK